MQRRLKRTILQIYKRALSHESSIILRTMIRRTVNKLKRGAYDAETEALTDTVRTHIRLVTDARTRSHLQRVLSILDEKESSSSDASQTSDEDAYYKVHSIVGVRFKGDAREYLVHWDGYDSSQDSWEPHETLVEDDCNDLVGKFHRRVIQRT